MSKKRKILFGVAVAAAWIIVLTLAAVFLLPKLLEQQPPQKEAPGAEDTVELALEGIICGGTEQPVLLGADGTPVAVSAPSGIAKLISEQLCYEILAVETEGESGTAQLHITAPDTPALVRSAVAQMETFDQEQFTQKMEELLEGEYAMVEYTLEVELVQVDALWCLVVDPNFSDAITGGLISRYCEVQEAIQQGLAGGGEQ